jgi:hypothetical protein
VYCVVVFLRRIDMVGLLKKLFVCSASLFCFGVAGVHAEDVADMPSATEGKIVPRKEGAIVPASEWKTEYVLTVYDDKVFSDLREANDFFAKLGKDGRKGVKVQAHWRTPAEGETLEYDRNEERQFSQAVRIFSEGGLLAELPQAAAKDAEICFCKERRERFTDKAAFEARKSELAAQGKTEDKDYATSVLRTCTWTGNGADLPIDVPAGLLSAAFPFGGGVDLFRSPFCAPYTSWLSAPFFDFPIIALQALDAPAEQKSEPKSDKNDKSNVTVQEVAADGTLTPPVAATPITPAAAVYSWNGAPRAAYKSTRAASERKSHVTVQEVNADETVTPPVAATPAPAATPVYDWDTPRAARKPAKTASARAATVNADDDLDAPRATRKPARAASARAFMPSAR